LLGLAVIIIYGVGIVIVASDVLTTSEPLPDLVAASDPILPTATPVSTATLMPPWTPTQTGTPMATNTLVVPWTPTRTPTGTPTATFTPMPTDTPSPTAMPTATPAPSPTATSTATSTPLPSQIQFYAERSSLVAGECTRLHWHVEEVQAVYLNGSGVAGQGTQRVCPKQATAYNLRVIHRDGNETVNTVFIEVIPLPSPDSPEFPTNKGVSLQKHYCQDVARLGGEWNYNWGPEPVQGCEAGFVPMVCGRFSETHLETAIFWAARSGWLLGFNEPDQPEQANIAPDQAAGLWRRIEEARPSGVRLISPVTAQGDLNWLRQWRNAYYAKYTAYPHVDAWAFHYYGGSARDLRNALDAMTAQLEAWGEPGEIWVTEFGRCDDKAVDFMEDAISIFKADPRVTRYAWFTNRIRGDESWNPGGICNPCALLTMDGQLRPPGQRYAAY